MALELREPQGPKFLSKDYIFIMQLRINKQYYILSEKYNLKNKKIVINEKIKFCCLMMKWCHKQRNSFNTYFLNYLSYEYTILC